ncbi:RDD family protein [Castellaniella hirudinis]|uniref:RDD family protein n=1 Tax=Castellaniella hirudinis TaxID=1144617 RepID=UPI0039C4128C
MLDTNPTAPVAPSRWRRFACMMYESVLLFGVVFLAGYLFDTLTQSRDGLMLRHGRQAFLFCAIGVYFLACWRRGGQTLPMKTWNIRLTDRGGRPLAGGRLALRYLLLWPIPLAAALLVAGLSHLSGWASLDLLIITAPFFHFIWTWFDPQGQFLHDRLLGTELHDLGRRTHD